MNTNTIPGLDLPALQDLLVIRPLKRGRIGASAQVHRTAKLVDIRITVFVHPLPQSVQQRHNQPRSMLQQHRDELYDMRAARIAFTTSSM